MSQQNQPDGWPYDDQQQGQQQPGNAQQGQGGTTDGYQSQMMPYGYYGMERQQMGGGMGGMPYMPQQQGYPTSYPGYGGQQPQGQGMPQMTPGQMMPPSPTLPLPANETSYIENILRLNLEKVATVYATFENNSEWNAKVFKGEVEAAGRDHVIINDGGPQGTRYLIPLIYVDYITFQGPINYSYPYA